MKEIIERAPNRFHQDKEKLMQTFIWVELPKKDDFLKVRETLTRIGIASRKTNTLWQSAHILHSQGRYAIVHFKELFALDGKPTDFSEDDLGRRNTIANLLAEWGLVKLLDPKKSLKPRASMNQIKVLPYKEKDNWELKSKYSIGRPRRRDDKRDTESF